MRPLQIAALLEMFEIAPDRRQGDADRLGQFLNRGRAPLADVLQHECAALRGDQFGASWRSHGLQDRRFALWTVSMTRMIAPKTICRNASETCMSDRTEDRRVMKTAPTKTPG